jgi:hypothetical protein
MMPERETFSLVGDMGEHYVQYLLGRIGIDAVNIDRVYDLFLWQNMHRVEVKTSKVNERQSRGYNNSKAYLFKFLKPQIQKDAFDYAICVGYDVNYNPKDVFVIPQGYIYEQGKRDNNLENKSVLIAIPIERPVRNKGTFKFCSNYDKFRMCIDNLDVFKQSNKSTFTRKKNQLTKRLLNYQEDCLKDMKEEFLKIYNDKDIHNPNQVVEDKLGIKHDIRWQWAKELGLGDQRKSLWAKKTQHEDKKMAPKVLALWKKGYTRTEIKKELKINSRRVTRICRELTLPITNPYRPKKVPWNKGKHTGNQYTGRLNK